MAQTESLSIAPAKPRIRVKAGSAQGSYMRDTQSGVIASRPASLREHRDEVRRVWTRAAGLAMDMLQNSGRLRGAADQIIADTVGVELSLNPKPDLRAFGYDDKEAMDLIKLIKDRFKVWAWNPLECDYRAKFTLPQLTDAGIRNWLAFGESLGVIQYLPRSQRLAGTRTGTKFLLFSPHRLVQDTSKFEGLYQGIIHDAFGRPIAYRVQEERDGMTVKVDYPARDSEGRQLVMHAFDPFSAEDVRGVSPLTPTFRKYLLAENVDDATAQLFFLQTIYSIILTSDKPSAEAFEALEALKDTGAENAADIAADFANYFGAQLERAAESEIKLGAGAGVSQLAPGESLDFKQLSAPGAQYSDFMAAMHRETARALGMSYGGYTLDYTRATYASTMMENSALWPISQRRTDRIAAPHMLVPYGAWLDEEIGEERIPFKGGYEAYRANRDAVQWALCFGPSKPTADDKKRADAATERLQNGTSTVEAECAEIGYDPEEVFESRKRWHERYKAAGMTSPFDRNTGTPKADATSGSDSGSATNGNS
ncbi:phage portal protein [Martelella sp. HB161492]|uniref:phage portal protein n=1 Tax=Martelella sp. HB161492 TaxID=2720726 RepID=UPI00158FCA10|nr:phage portal protein [Martelella sp. HB161492]